MVKSEFGGVSGAATVAEFARTMSAFELCVEWVMRGYAYGWMHILMRLPLGARWQRWCTAYSAFLLWAGSGVAYSRRSVGRMPVRVISPTQGPAKGVILYLHGGGFVCGSAYTHRSITSRLARRSGLDVWVPAYRLAPEAPYPAAQEDAMAAYQALLAQGYAPSQIVLAGDSSGGMLTLALAITLREQGFQAPAALLLLAPQTDLTLAGQSMRNSVLRDPMLRRAWLAQVNAWYQCPADVRSHQPLHTALAGLPPMMVQVGTDDLLLCDSTRLAAHAARCGVPCYLEVYQQRGHMFHINAAYLRPTRQALHRLAQFARQRIDAGLAQRAAH